MRNWIARWIANALALLIVVNLPIGISIDRHHLGVALVIAVIALGLVNALIRPIIMFFVWPINCLTFGLLGFVVNVLLFWLVLRNVPGFKMAPGPLPPLLGSVLMGIFSGIINFFLKDHGDRDE